MKIQIQRIFVLLSIVILIISCTKDDSPTEQVSIDGGEVFRYQAVEISINNVALDEVEYQGLLGEQMVLLRKTGKNTLAFVVPSDITLGKSDLVIGSLGNLKIHYNLLDTKLTGGYNSVLIDFFENMNTYSQVLTDSPEDAAIKQSFSDFNAIYQNAAEEDKIKMASNYKANKQLFDSAFLNSATPNGKFMSSSDNDLIGLFANLSNKVGILQILLDKVKLENLIGVQPFLAAEKNLKANFLKLKTIGLIKTNIEIEGVEAVSSGASKTIDFKSKSVKTVSMYLVGRTLIDSDGASAKGSVGTIFNSVNSYNSNIQWVNEKIDLFNKLPLVNIDLISIINFGENYTYTYDAVNQEIFDHIVLSVKDQDLSLVKKVFSEDGKVEIQIDIINPSIDVKLLPNGLYFNYFDEINDFDKYVSINVDKGACGDVVAEGVTYTSRKMNNNCWMEQNLRVTRYRNGDQIPQVQDPNEWARLTTGAWCYYENNPSKGVLYNAFAVRDSRGLAPKGWHVPSIDEMYNAVNSLDMILANKPYFDVFGGYLPGGAGPGIKIDFAEINVMGYWWLANVGSSNPYGLQYSYSQLSWGTPRASNVMTQGASNGLSVRCVKD